MNDLLWIADALKGHTLAPTAAQPQEVREALLEAAQRAMKFSEAAASAILDMIDVPAEGDN